MATLFSIIKNPYVLLGIPIIIALVLFRRQVGETLGYVGSNLGVAGQGFQTFISAVSSPKITPEFGLKLSGVFGDIQSGINQWYQDTYRSGNQNSDKKSSAPVSAGGFNVAQSTSESGGTKKKTYDLSKLPGPFSTR